MSRLSELLRQVALKDERLAADLKRETDALAERRSFGLNFERHVPEAVELPGRPVRKNDKVHALLTREKQARLANLRAIRERDQTDAERDELSRLELELRESNSVLWRVASVDRKAATATLTRSVVEESEALLQATEVPLDDLAVVAEFRDPIYPGLVSTGKVERGGPVKPYHAVINAENYHALQALLFTHRGKVDAIYIDPPYNTGAKDWKYNNDYVEADDLYRHSKWLAMMERRLRLAKELLNPDHSVLIVTIDEKEYLRLGLLLEQLFPDGRAQMISTVINRKGNARRGEFSRSEEFVYFVRFGNAGISPWRSDMLNEAQEGDNEKIRWKSLLRLASTGQTSGRFNMFYPLFFDSRTLSFVFAGEPIPDGVPAASVQVPDGMSVLWPIQRNGSDGRWSLSKPKFEEYLRKGYIKFGSKNGGGRTPYYLMEGQIAAIESGDLVVTGRDSDGAVELKKLASQRSPLTIWNQSSHSTSGHGTALVKDLLVDRAFPYPKSLYAVEDALRFAVLRNRDAVVVDFFAGSGTTTHAVMRLNRQDGGRRRSILVTNNEVAADEQKALRAKGLRPGDVEWERWGICEYITRPRIAAAINGKKPDGTPINGNYKFTDEFPMADGFEENVEFFTLTYEAPLRVSTNREFGKIAPFLWLRAGSRGRRIDDVSTGWDVAEAYGVIADLDQSEQFLKAMDDAPSVTHAFIVTDEDRLFEAMVRQLPAHVEPVRLYEAYLRNFEIEAGRAAR
ncbi:DNA methyltransferase [Micromonospora sp. CPCC 205539]|uniref:site-specific DNA-methyltransferase n=1 Tax=Micromonospora sp. CPCC 205539 TaxID=3122408 RepID=UPI002FF357DD